MKSKLDKPKKKKQVRNYEGMQFLMVPIPIEIRRPFTQLCRYRERKLKDEVARLLAAEVKRAKIPASELGHHAA